MKNTTKNAGKKTLSKNERKRRTKQIFAATIAIVIVFAMLLSAVLPFMLR